VAGEVVGILEHFWSAVRILFFSLWHLIIPDGTRCYMYMWTKQLLFSEFGCAQKALALFALLGGGICFLHENWILF
jgi:hypothetical protein